MPRKTKTPEVISETPKSKQKIAIPLGTLIWALLFLIAVGAAGYFYYQTKHPEKLTQEKEKEELTETLGQFLELPKDETPTLATVTDREKLADQPFFLMAENGDKVLIYSKSGKAILYRPSTKKVIDMTIAAVEKPVADTQVQETPAAAEEASSEESGARQDLTVTLLNGSTKVGVTAEAEKKIGESLKDYTIEKKTTANKNDYQGVIVVDREGANAERAKELAELLGGRVETLPEGEAGESDIVIIIGN